MRRIVAGLPEISLVEFRSTAEHRVACPSELTLRGSFGYTLNRIKLVQRWLDPQRFQG